MNRRIGDSVEIDGGYQHRALISGNPIQRFWHETKQLTIEKILPPQPSDFVLDVGCGSGVITSVLAKTARKVIGIDGNKLAIDYASTTFNRSNISFVQGLVDEHFYLEERPDKIYSLEVIEHIYWDQGVTMLRSFKSLLAEGGKVFLTTPNYNSLWPIIEWGMDHFSNAAHLDSDQHVLHFNKKTLRKICEEAGFVVDSLYTVSFLAPWLAPINYKLARFCHRAEMRTQLFPGSILVAVLSQIEIPNEKIRSV